MTVEIETPEGLRSGSRVRRIDIRENVGFLPGAPINKALSGEAIPIDLPGGQTLFVLVSDPAQLNAAVELAFEAFASEIEAADAEAPDRRPDWSRRIQILKQSQRVVEVTGDDRLIFVTFSDPLRPETVSIVDPVQLDAGFGRGHRLRRVSIEVTDDEVEDGIRQRLPWLNTAGPPRFRTRGLETDDRITLMSVDSFMRNDVL